jgi:hypothetical protein
VHNLVTCKCIYEPRRIVDHNIISLIFGIVIHLYAFPVTFFAAR